MIIHSYLTNGEPMYNFAVLFLESFKYHHGENTKIVFSARDLDDEQIELLHMTYKNLEIVNKSFDYDYLCNTTGYSIEHIKSLKESVEKGINISGKPDHIIMKQYISVEDRYRNSITEVIDKFSPDYLLHLDIDICFNNKIYPMVDIIKDNDVSFKFRTTPNWKRLIVGYALGFTINNNSKKFLETWKSYIDEKSLLEKPKGYGQHTLWMTYEKLKNDVKFGTFPVWTTGSSINYTENAVLLSGHKKKKVRNIKLFKNIYRD